MDHIRQWQEEYEMARENVGREDKRLQDLLHEIEFSPNAKERNRAAAKLRRSRKIRRENKDRALLLEYVVQFFGEEPNRKVLNQLTQLLGRQRKQEAFLRSERTYKPRVEELPTAMGEALERGTGTRKGK